MVKAIKKQKAIFIFSKMIVLGLLALFFYFQFQKIDWSKEQIYLEHPIALATVFLLIPLNWIFEWWKWRLTLRIAEVRATEIAKRQSFFAGIVTGMLTPNMLGNFLGRMYYFDRRYRVSLVVLTLVGNYAQFIASIVFGIIAVIALGISPLDMALSDLKWILISAAVLLVLFYFQFEWLFRFSKKKARIHKMIRDLNRRKLFRWQILGLSVVRHAIFVLQFSLMLYAFGEDLSWVNILWIWQVYLWVTLAPSLFLGKLAIRESIAMWVLAFAGMGGLTVLVSSFLIWTFNLLIPTIISLIICKNKS